MKVALIGDVHANLPALEAVLDDARSADVDAVWNLGDFLGYGPFPDEVVGRLCEEAAVNLLGNYDAKVLRFERKRDKWRRTRAADKFLAFQWAHDNISQQSRRFLQTLDFQYRLQVGRLRVLLTHGSPAAEDEALGPDTPDERFEQLARTAGADVIACGHSHRPFTREAAGVRFVNPGSVGRPEGDDPRACWALLDFDTALDLETAGSSSDVSVRQRRVEYDIERTVEAIRRADLPEEFGRMLLEGKNLNEVRHG